jgi:DNA modification methylase
MPIAKLKRPHGAGNLKVTNRALHELRPYPGNAKTHGKRQLAALAKNIVNMGFLNPILVDETNEILAGHGRYEAARIAGLDRVPTITIAHLLPAQKKAYRIADNRLGEVDSGWSMESLAREVDAILGLDGDFDLELTGFSAADLELKLDVEDSKSQDEQAEIPAPPEVAVTRLGELWQLGEHRLLCGDALVEKNYKLLLGSSRADMLFADSPFNCKINGHVSGLGKQKHREFVQGAGELSDPEFQRFLLTFMLHCARFVKRGGLHFICMDWRQIGKLLAAGEAAYDELINLCVWIKSNGGMGSLYRSQHELIAVFKHGKVPHLNNVMLGAKGRNRTNVWSYPGMNAPSAERTAALAMHSTVKPLALVRDAILDVTGRGDIVLDPFGGSGTTLIAAHAVGRVARLMELDPLYCDVIIERTMRETGLTPVLAATGQTWAEVSKERGGAR